MVCQSFYRQYIPRFLVTAAQAGPQVKACFVIHCW